MNYEQCLVYLDQIQSLGIKFGLDNVKAVLSSIGDPHIQYPSILVAGTNGKGSVCAMLTQILLDHGYCPGLYTSPHLITVRERIRIGQELIPKDDFSRHLTYLRETIESLIVSKKLLSPPTYFEILSCLAFLYFAVRRVDIAICEVGMGGRYDATNVVNPVVSAITTISPEHQKFLGETLREIAAEKAGIIKPGIPIVCGVEEEEAYNTIKKRAEELNAPFFPVCSDNLCLKEKTKQNFRFEYSMDKVTYTYSPALLGEHQGKNAAMAIAVSRHLSKKWRRLKKAQILHGIETARWPGRLEVVSVQPLVIVDGAHNEEGAKALRAYIQEFIGPLKVLVFAVMRDKNIGSLSEILFPLARTVILTKFPFFKAAAPEDIQRQASRFQDRIVIQPDVRQALRIARQTASPDGAVLVAGSLFLVGEVKKIFSSVTDWT